VKLHSSGRRGVCVRAVSSAFYPLWLQHFCPSLLFISCLAVLEKKMLSSEHKGMKRKIFGNHCYSVSRVKFWWFLFFKLIF